MFNGMGGACAALIGLTEYQHNIGKPTALSFIVAGMVIGTISFSGSIIAYLKLAGKMNAPVRLPQYNLLNNVVLFIVTAFSVFIIIQNESLPESIIWVLFAIAIIYGVLFTIPIGGADMPVVISLLNSFTGLAAAFGGFLYDNKPMLTGGILVGSAGTLLTLAMCKAMNRSLTSVIFGAFGGGSAAAAGDSATGGTIKDIQVSDLAVLLNYSKKVVIVPGYGLAVAQAQHVIHELEKLLEERDVEEYAKGDVHSVYAFPAVMRLMPRGRRPQ